MLILCLDSSGKNLRTGLYKNGDVLSEITSDSMGNHSEHIIHQIDNMLTETSKVLDEVNLLAINIGPGSFTGLRIGMAAMAGISFARNIPLAGFNGFEVIAEDLRFSHGKYLALIQCRGDEFYSAEYSVMDGSVTLMSDYKIISTSSMNLNDVELTLVGPGAGLYHNMTAENVKHKFNMASELHDIPSLMSLAKLAVSNSIDAQKIPELFYLAPSQAEVNYDRKKAEN
jgi:tRNA threonylcarbamoyladenosine biosynthesis protein TsaB